MEGSWKDLMDYVFELDEEVGVIIGCSDIAHKEGYSSLYLCNIFFNLLIKVFLKLLIIWLFI
jgi:hypothetical protein